MVFEKLTDIDSVLIESVQPFWSNTTDSAALQSSVIGSNYYVGLGKIVTGFAKRGLPRTSNSMNLENHNYTV